MNAPRPNRFAHCLVVPLVLAWIAASASAAPGADSATARKLFAQPPREYATAPLWVWNDQLTEAQVRETLRDLASQQVRQVFVHPRPGLMTPYLGPEWFKLWKVALDEARRLDMNCWIYDENSYPSGFAGGWVPELMPESRGRGLHLRAVNQAPKWEPTTSAVFALEQDRATDVSEAARAGTLPPQGRYLIANIQRAPNRGWHGGRSYVDLLYPGVTQKFLEVTLEAYRKELGTEFGRRIPGSFTDEPEIRPAGGLPWTDDLPQQFQQRWGYSLNANLPALSQEVGDWRKVRHNYFHQLNSLFIERWAKPYYEWCEKNRLQFTGHYWDHDWPKCVTVPSNMAMAAWQHVPGIDCLMNQYREDTNAQFGNVRFVRELASVANQLGRTRTLCEIYGAAGWELRFEDMKRIGDWLGVLGVNFFDEHLSYVTIRGARKRDHPQSFSYHEPWWEAYHVNASYLTRLSCALAQGEQINRILVLEPTSTAWMYQGDDARLKPLGAAFTQLLMSLEAAQVEYDLGDEDIMARHGSVAGAELVVGRRRYSTLVLPPGTENLDEPTVKLVAAFMRGGGNVIASGDAPNRVNGAPSEAVRALAGSKQWRRVEPAALAALLQAIPAEDGFKIARRSGDQGILFHQRRQLADGELLLLVNTSSDHPSEGAIESSRHGVEEWNLYSGKTRAAAFEKTAGGVRIEFNLPPAGSRLLFLSRRNVTPASPVGPTKLIAASGPMQTARVGPNVLTLDHVDLTVAGETRQNLYFYQAGQLAFQKNGMERNPWDSAVQFRDELLQKKFAPDSGFEASYRFSVLERVPADLAIVIERPDLYSVTCNGQSISAKPGDWWLDKAFGRIPLAAVARVGENVVTVRCAPFSILHELEPAYVIGSFALTPVAKGFAIAPERPLQAGPWKEQGLPLYAGGVSYRQSFRVDAASSTTSVALGSWHGTVAKVLVNGKPAGYVTAPPYECEISQHLRSGENTIEVTVFGSLKNTLGPHHGEYPAGSAWPQMFQTGPKGGLPPGRAYQTIGYGLFEPFVLKQRANRG